jgi:hypothetical protein
MLDPPGAHDADTAQLDVPCNDPVNPSVEMVDPVTTNPLVNSNVPEI